MDPTTVEIEAMAGNGDRLQALFDIVGIDGDSRLRFTRTGEIKKVREIILSMPRTGTQQ